MPIFGNRIDFNNLRRRNIQDEENEDIGRIIDFVLTKDYQLSKFILGGSKLEEFKERIGLKIDDDPVVSVNLIEEPKEADNYSSYKINDKGENLLHKLQEGAIKETELIYSNLSKLPVHSNDGQSVGRIVDAIFCEDSTVCFVIGENPLIEFLEKIGLLGNYDLLLPTSEISEINEKNIIIKKSKEELRVLLNNQEHNHIKVADYKTTQIAKLKSGVTRYSGVLYGR